MLINIVITYNYNIICNSNNEIHLLLFKMKFKFTNNKIQHKIP